MSKLVDQKKLKWDTWFYEITEKVSENTKCLSRKVGAILVVDKTIISTGYNGPARLIPHCNERYILDSKLIEELERKNIDPSDEKYHNICPRQVLKFKSGEGLEFCIAGHAERNAIINASREGTKIKGSIMYMNCGIPCKDCLIEIIGSGIEQLVVTKLTYYDFMSEYLLKNSNLKCRVYSNLCNHEDSVGKYCKICDSILEGEW